MVTLPMVMMSFIGRASGPCLYRERESTRELGAAYFSVASLHDGLRAPSSVIMSLSLSLLVEPRGCEGKRALRGKALKACPCLSFDVLLANASGDDGQAMAAFVVDGVDGQGNRTKGLPRH
ncbi:hypothetical protein L7F22_054465 [Adiantum nelumboides]|nr:hypothetical protein [Adiantum nelumboides]